jgi:hypothetical protein
VHLATPRFPIPAHALPDPRIDPAKIVLMGFSRGGRQPSGLKRFERMHGPEGPTFAADICSLCAVLRSLAPLLKYRRKSTVCILAHVADHIDESGDFRSLFDLVNHLLGKTSRLGDFQI